MLSFNVVTVVNNVTLESNNSRNIPKDEYTNMETDRQIVIETIDEDSDVSKDKNQNARKDEDSDIGRDKKQNARKDIIFEESKHDIAGDILIHRKSYMEIVKYSIT